MVLLLKLHRIFFPILSLVRCQVCAPNRFYVYLFPGTVTAFESFSSPTKAANLVCLWYRTFPSSLAVH